MPLIRSAGRCSALSLITEKTEMLDLSPGICVFFSHVPLAYLSKSSPAFTDVSISDLSTPDWVPCTASVPLALPLPVLLHAASAIADAATIRIERFILGLSTVLPLPDVAATRAAGLFDQRTSLRHERTAH